MKKFFLGLYACVMASAIIAIIVVTMFYLPIQTFVLKNRYNNWLQNIKNYEKMKMAPSKKVSVEDVNERCIPQKSGALSVGGIYRNDVPQLPNATRLSYDNYGTSQYTSFGDADDILGFYLSQLASQCWQISALRENDAMWTKVGQSLKIAIAQNPYGGKNRVVYQIGGGVVLGETYQAAQTTCPEGQMYCGDPCGGGTGGCASVTSCPTTCGGGTTGTTPTCPAAPSGCTSGYTYTNGCPTGCNPSTTTGGTGGTSPTACTSEQTRCYGSSGDTVGWCQMPPCPSSGTTGGSTWPSTESGCIAEGKTWCPSSSGSFAGACYYSGTTCPVNCPSGQYSCNGVCKLNTDTNCTWGGTTGTACSSGQTRCFSSSTDIVGWCQWPPCPASGSTTNTNANWRQKTWILIDGSESSNILNRSDQEYTGYIASIEQQCRQISRSKFSWKMGAGNDSDWKNFGIPDCSGNGGTASGTASCPVGQYLCNNNCVANGSSCNNHPYYPPGTSDTGTNTQPTQSCGQCKTYDGVKCVYAQAGTADPVCGAGAYCDGYGGCVRLGSGRTFVGNGAICGDGFCEPNLGENRDNCVKECQNAPTQTTQNQNQQNQQRQQDQRGQRDQFPGQGDGNYPGGEQDEAMRKKINEEQLTRMKKEMGRMKSVVGKMANELTKKKYKFVGKPKELVEAIAKANEIFAAIESSESVDGLENIMTDLFDVMNVLGRGGDWFRMMNDLEQMIKQADREVKNINKAITRLEKQAKKNETVQDLISEIKGIQVQMADTLGKAKVLAKEGDIEAAFEMMEDGYFGNMEEFWNKISEADLLLNLTQGVKKAAAESKRLEARVKTVIRKQKLEEDVAAQGYNMIADLKGMLAELQVAAKQKPVDTEELMGIGSRMFEQVELIEEWLAEHGDNAYGPKLQKFDTRQYEIPDAFDFGGHESQPGFGGPSSGGFGGVPTGSGGNFGGPNTGGFGGIPPSGGVGSTAPGGL